MIDFGDVSITERRTPPQWPAPEVDIIGVLFPIGPVKYEYDNLDWSHYKDAAIKWDYLPPAA